MSIDTNPEKIKELLERGVQEVIDKSHLEKALQSGKKLRVKFGIDPTSPDLHLGHFIPLRKLRQFQELGHQVILLIGDFTAQIGDPTGKSSARKTITEKEVKENMKEYTNQAGKILNLKKIELRYNSEWYNKKGVDFAIQLASKFTFARLIERDDFQKRIKADIDVSMNELIYPLLQGYDSVELKADVEIGGTDQKFNLLYGRKVQKKYEIPEQDVMTLPLLVGTDGTNKMSKSLGNFIKITEEPSKMFGLVMSIPDNLIWNYYHLLTNIPDEQIKKIKEKVRHYGFSPMQAKMDLSEEIVKNFYGEKKAQGAKKEFEKVHQKGELPSEIREVEFPEIIKLTEMLHVSGVADSIGAGRRLIEQGAVEVDNEKITDWTKEIKIKDGAGLKLNFTHQNNSYICRFVPR